MPKTVTNWKSVCMGWLICLAAAASWAGIKPAALRCEYKVDPVGIEEAKPRLYWLLEGDGRGQIQSAYQVQVATTAEQLDEGKADLWDSAKVASGETAHIVYNGKPLASWQQCWWRVRVWDGKGEKSDWSAPAQWTMGLLQRSDWTAQWIGFETPASRPIDFSGCHLMWVPGGDPLKESPKVQMYLRRDFTIPKDATVAKMRGVVMGKDQVEIMLNSFNALTLSYNTGTGTTRRIASLSNMWKPGENTLSLRVSVTEPGPAWVMGKFEIEYADGHVEHIFVDTSWKGLDKEQNGWMNPGFNETGWTGLKDFGAPSKEILSRLDWRGDLLTASPYLRKEFQVTKPVKRALVAATAQGLYEMHMNGQRVSEDLFAPGWTEYSKRYHYRLYDVTKMVKQGSNAIGAILGDGWYAGRINMNIHLYGKLPRLLAQLRIEYQDGTFDTIVTDNSWAGTEGPILESDYLSGEFYDARLDQRVSGWDRPNFNQVDWRFIQVDPNPTTASLNAYPTEPVGRAMELKPKSVKQIRPGTYLFDMGQNMVGWVRLKAQGLPGQRILVRHGEMLDSDGSLYVLNLRQAASTDLYILKGGAQETLEPHFTFHGFRYVEVTGYPGGEPPLDALTGIVIHSLTPEAGKFECSEPEVNQLMSNINWSRRGNFFEIPTDCPQRNERLGWMGDAQVFVNTAAYLCDVASFFKKWMVDVADAQKTDGGYTDVSPDVLGGSGAAAWGDAGFICTYAMYHAYGDTAIINQQWDSMVKGMEYYKRNSPGLVRPETGYGDWLNIDADLPRDVIGTAYFAWDAAIMAEMAQATGRAKEAAEYQKLFEDVKAAFNKAFVAEDGKIKGDTQTAYLLALSMNLLPEAKRPLAAKHLIDNIKARGWKLSVGFVGVSMLEPTLTALGRTDLAYHLLESAEYPGWLFEIKNGATTIWERWDAWTPEKGFQSAGMNSFNHYSFGSIGQWLFGTVGGIASDGPGFKKIVIRPRPGGKMEWVNCSYNSIRGLIRSDWKAQGEDLAMNVTVPAGTTATVYVPAADANAVTEGGKPAAEAKAVKFVKMDGGAAVYEVGSGDYSFVSKGASKLIVRSLKAE